MGPSLAFSSLCGGDGYDFPQELARTTWSSVMTSLVVFHNRVP